MKYEIATEGEWFKPKHRGFKMACCDCGLVHICNFRLKPYKGGMALEMQMFRDKRATGAVRRKKKI
jgi:hypothetical protein